MPLRPTLVATLSGGLIGALLLLTTPATVFDHVLPWLLLIATVAMAFGKRLGAALRARFRAGIAAVCVVQFLLGVYGGYFGGAVGLMMVAAWGLLDGAEIAALHAPRTLLVTAANTVAVVVFAIAGAVVWRDAVTLALGAIVGGWLGALAGKRLPALVIRAATVVITTVVTIHFFVRAYWPAA